jgi:hypothetical protein
MELFLSVVPYIELMFLLMIGHAFADYPMQSDFVATAKNHTTELGKVFWKWVLPSHGLIHAAPVYLITGSFVLALAEFVCHTVIDYLKCDGKLTFNQDQWLHVACKVLWVGLLALELPFLVE